MKANELRIENWYDHNGIPKQATPNTIEEVWESERSWCKPIPLTEEWLLKLGAKKFDAGFVIDRFRLLYRSEYGYYYVINKYTNEYFSKVEFVHEWQNLFFAMNNQELIIQGT
jgi:hypothetical protein